jgi:ribulose 1,5-bisphosphate synthetase/thiazole synthase
MLLELDIPFIEKDNYVTVKNPSSLISALLNKTLNHSKSEFVFLGNLEVRDYLFRGSECCGVSCSFGSEGMTEVGSHFNQSSPFPFFASTVISACGSRSSFARMRSLGWVDAYYDYSADSMNMNVAEDSIVHHTRVVAPSLIMGGVEIAYLDGLPVPGYHHHCHITITIIIIAIIIPIITANYLYHHHHYHHHHHHHHH